VTGLIAARQWLGHVVHLGVDQREVEHQPEAEEGGGVVPLQLLGHLEVHIDVILGVELFQVKRDFEFPLF